jgi:tRNA(fMet)-specific endonuclease VapC
VASVLIDTSVLIDDERRGRGLQQLVGDDERAISVVTVSELLHGVHRADSDARRVRRQAFVERLLAGIQPVPVTEQIARVHADIWARLEASGNTIGAHDLWIAATALGHGMRLATTNRREFERVPGLTVIAL